MPSTEGRFRPGTPGKDPDMIAIDALGFIAGRGELMQRFLDLTGFAAHQLRTEAKNPSFFVGVLDFILRSENDLMDFAGAADLKPQEVGRARNQLAVKAGISPEDYPV